MADLILEVENSSDVMNANQKKITVYHSIWVTHNIVRLSLAEPPIPPIQCYLRREDCFRTFSTKHPPQPCLCPVVQPSLGYRVVASPLMKCCRSALLIGQPYRLQHDSQSTNPIAKVLMASRNPSSTAEGEV